MQDFLYNYPTEKAEEITKKKQIVLIGAFGQDIFQTPYGEMSGIEVHAHMVSQILSAVQDNRPLIWVLPLPQEILWIWVWLFLGSILAFYLYPFHLRWISYIATVIPISAVLIWTCYVCLSEWGGFLPLIPPAFGLIIMPVIVFTKISR